MIATSLYEQQDYQKAIRQLTTERRTQFGARFTFEKMAQSCGVQKTYLSKVLNGGGHLNADQLYSACEFLKLSPSETEFLLTLRELQLATHVQRKKNLGAKLEKLKRTSAKTEAVLEATDQPLIENHLWEYYTSIDLQIVYLFLTIPTFAGDALSIASKIGITEARLKDILLKLQTWNLIQFDGKKYRTKDPNFHLSQDSAIHSAFALLNRLRTAEKFRQIDLSQSDDYFFSALFSAERSFQAKFKKKFLGLLKEMQTEVLKAKSEDVYQVNIDFFRWS